MPRIFLYEGHTRATIERILVNSPKFADTEILSSKQGIFSFGNMHDLLIDFDLMFVRLHIRPPNGTTEEEIRKFFNVREWFNVMLSASQTVSDDRFVNHPLKALLAESKPLQLKVAEACGFVVPKTLFSNDPEAQLDFVRGGREPFVAKPIDNSLIANPKDPSDTLMVLTRRISEDDLQGASSSVDDPPCIIQEEVHKEFELRVILYGDQIRLFKIDSQRHTRSKIDFRWQQANPELYSTIDDAWGLFKPCRQYLDELGLDSGVFDFAIRPDGTPVFFECNPNGQWAGINSFASGDLDKVAADYFRMRLDEHL